MSLIQCIVTSPISHPTRRGHRVEVGQEIALTPGQFERLHKHGCVEVASAHRILEDARKRADEEAKRATEAALAEAAKAKAEAEKAAELERARAEALAKTDLEKLDKGPLIKLARDLGVEREIDKKASADDIRAQLRRALKHGE